MPDSEAPPVAPAPPVPPVRAVATDAVGRRRRRVILALAALLAAAVGYPAGRLAPTFLARGFQPPSLPTPTALFVPEQPDGWPARPEPTGTVQRSMSERWTMFREFAATDPEAALSEFDEIDADLMRDPESPYRAAALWLKAELCLRLGREGPAQAALGEFLSEFPHAWRGQAAEVALARLALRAAARGEPEALERGLRFTLAALHGRIRGTVRARRLELLAPAGGAAPLYLEYARLLSAAGRPVEACAILEEHALLEPLGQLYRRSPWAAEAARLLLEYRAAARRAPPPPPSRRSGP